MNNTFVLLARSILDSQVFANEKMLKIWIWCLCKANHKTAFVPLKVGKGITQVKVERGQFIFGRNKAEEELFYDGSTIYKIMQKMQVLEMISIKSNNQYSIITICKYDTYQTADNYQVTSKEQPSNNQRTTNEQPSNTNKNDNNKKKVNKEIDFPFSSIDFLTAWNSWKEYKKAEFNFTYKSEISENAGLKELANIANQQEETAIKIINYSIAKSYKGLFPIPNQKNNIVDQKPKINAAPQMTESEYLDLFAPKPKVNGVHP